MRFVYGIAFDGEEFIMVFNSKRGGWEMPGGALEIGESDEEAMIREFREEVGCDFIPISSQVVGEGRIFVGRIGSRMGTGEMRWSRFEQLPDGLSFPEVEYKSLVDWGRRKIRLK